MPLREPSRGTAPKTVSLALAGIPAELWDRLRSASRRLLLLDYDGTLAPHHAQRNRALAPLSTRRRLETLTESLRTTLVVISGRPIAELLSLLGDLPIHWIGEHGWEERDPEGEIREHPLSHEAHLALDGAWRAVGPLGLQTRVERKRTGLVLHTRGLFPDADQALTRAAEAVWRPWVDRAPLRMDAIHGGLELRAMGHDKGTAAIACVRRAGPRTFVVCVGDDESDEDAFRALGDLAFGIRVGAEDVPTRARGRLARPAAVDEFLARWLDSETVTRPAWGVAR